MDDPAAPPGAPEPRKCADCGEVIEGRVLIALEKSWHPEHFKCTECQTTIGSGSFMVHDDQPYCEADYHKLFSPQCAKCREPIKTKYVTALEQTWHPEHFTCAECDSQLGEEGFHTQGGKPYCREHFYQLFAPKCDACGKPLVQSYLSALGRRWHPDCFICSVCNEPVQGPTFTAREGKPVCNKCSGVTPPAPAPAAEAPAPEAPAAEAPAAEAPAAEAPAAEAPAPEAPAAEAPAAEEAPAPAEPTATLPEETVT